MQSKQKIRLYAVSTIVILILAGTLLVGGSTMYDLASPVIAVVFVLLLALIAVIVLRKNFIKAKSANPNYLAVMLTALPAAAVSLFTIGMVFTVLALGLGLPVPITLSICFALLCAFILAAFFVADKIHSAKGLTKTAKVLMSILFLILWPFVMVGCLLLIMYMVQIIFLILGRQT